MALRMFWRVFLFVFSFSVFLFVLVPVFQQTHLKVCKVVVVTLLVSIFSSQPFWEPVRTAGRTVQHLDPLPPQLCLWSEAQTPISFKKDLEY